MNKKQAGIQLEAVTMKQCIIAVKSQPKELLARH